MLSEEEMNEQMSRIVVNYASDRDVKNLEESISKVFLNYINPPSRPKLHKEMVNIFSLMVQAAVPSEGII